MDNMMEKSKAAISRLWWFIRGVRSEDYRHLCRRCQRTGQTHWALFGCWRFRGYAYPVSLMNRQRIQRRK